MRSWIFSFASVALISTGMFSVVFFNIDPSGASQITIFGLFFSLFFALFSILTIAYSLISRYKNHVFLHKDKVRVIRRSIFLSILTVGLLLFSALKVLNFLSVLNFVLVIILLEVFFVSRSREKTYE